LSEQKGRGSLILDETVVAGVGWSTITEVIVDMAVVLVEEVVGWSTISEVIVDMAVVEGEEESRVCSTLLRKAWYMCRDRNKVEHRMFQVRLMALPSDA